MAHMILRHLDKALQDKDYPQFMEETGLERLRNVAYLLTER